MVNITRGVSSYCVGVDAALQQIAPCPGRRVVLLPAPPHLRAAPHHSGAAHTAAAGKAVGCTRAGSRSPPPPQASAGRLPPWRPGPGPGAHSARSARLHGRVVALLAAALAQPSPSPSPCGTQGAASAPGGRSSAAWSTGSDGAQGRGTSWCWQRKAARRRPRGLCCGGVRLREPSASPAAPFSSGGLLCGPGAGFFRSPPGSAACPWGLARPSSAESWMRGSSCWRRRGWVRTGAPAGGWCPGPPSGWLAAASACSS